MGDLVRSAVRESWESASPGMMERVDSSMQCFLEFPFEEQGSRCLTVDYVDGRASLRVVDWSELTSFEKLSSLISGSGSLQTVVDFVQLYLIRYTLEIGAVGEKIQSQCVLLRQKVKEHNRGLFNSSIDFNYPFEKKEFTLIVTLPLVPKNFGDPLEFETREVKVKYTPVTTFAKIEKILACLGPWLISREVTLKGQTDSLPSSDVTLEKWVQSYTTDCLSVSYYGIDVDAYVRHYAHQSYCAGLDQGLSRVRMF